MGKGLRSGSPQNLGVGVDTRQLGVGLLGSTRGQHLLTCFPRNQAPEKLFVQPGHSQASQAPVPLHTVNCTLKVQAGDLLGRRCAGPIVFARPAVDSALALPALLQLCPFTLPCNCQQTGLPPIWGFVPLAKPSHFRNIPEIVCRLLNQVLLF